MPFALIIIGTILALAAYRDTLPELFAIVKDVTAEANGFGYWILASIILGFLASIQSIKKPVNAFMILLMLVLLIRKRGTLEQMATQIKG